MTISGPVRHRGPSLGVTTPVTVTIGPADGSGITFNGIPATAANARVHGHTTYLRQGRRSVGMVEHLLAACAGLGITDLAVTLDSDALPLLDGSSLPYVRAFRRAGLRKTGRREPAVVLLRPVAVRAGDSFAAALPSRQLRFSVLVTPPAAPALQHFTAAITPATFTTQVAPARTFGPASGSPAQVRRRLQLPYALRRHGGILRPVTPRLPFEPCRHKLLDLLGDLALLGRPLRADVFAFRPSHRLNLALVRAIAKQLEA